MNSKLFKIAYRNKSMPVLLFCIILAISFVLWITEESKFEKNKNAFIGMDLLLARNVPPQEIYQFLKTEMNEGATFQLEWVHFLRYEKNNKDQMSMLIEVVRLAPNREATYKHIKELLSNDIENFDKKQFLIELNNISGVKRDLLAKYFLTI